MTGLRVLIVGASIAGPTAAYWLARTGAQVTIIERFPELRKGGQNIDIRTVGVTVMRKMQGMEDAVRANLAPIEGMSIVRESGRPYFVFTPTGDPDQQSMVSEYEIFRGDLSKILYDMTKDHDNIRYVFGEQVASVEQGDGNGPVTVNFASGRPSAEFDLIVAADGSASRTRAMALGCGVRDYTRSFNTWAAYCTINQDLIQGSKIATGFNAAPGLMMGLSADRLPGHNKVILGSIYSANDEKAMSEFREALKQGGEVLKTFVAKRFQGIGWKSSAVLEAMKISDDFSASEWMQVKVPTLAKGRFVLIGDAGHSAGPTGTGTSLALAGAYLLAGEVGKHKGDLSAGLKAYEDRMQPLLKRMMNVPPMFPGIMAPQTAWRLHLRNAVLALICWGAGVFGPLFSWLGGFLSSAFSNAENSKLPEYEWDSQ